MKSLDDIISLEWHTGTKENQRRYSYSLEKLDELQSRLALIAKDIESANKNAIKDFETVCEFNVY